MIPVKLSLSGFLSYRQPVEIDFTGFDLACISGSNGAGKSSILDAITWALFGQARKRDDALINKHSETAEVVFTFIYEGNTYKVQRAKSEGKATLLEFHILSRNGKWKPLTERSLRGTENLIQETLRLDYETFVNASFFLQGKADQFTQQRAGDRKRILSSILGLEVWESYRKQGSELRKHLEDQITELEGRLQEINVELAEEPQRVQRLADLQGSLKTTSHALAAQKTALDEKKRRAASLAEQEKLVNTLAGQLERMQGEISTLQLRLEARQAEKHTLTGLLERADEVEAAYQAWQTARQEVERWNEQEKRRHAPLTEIETSRTRLEAERETLLQRQKALAEAAAVREELLKGKADLEKKVAEIGAKLESRTRLEEERQKALEALAAAKAENPLLNEEMNRLNIRIKQLKASDGAVCPTCGQPLDAEERQRLIDKTQAEGTEMGDKYRANNTLMREGDQQIKAFDEQIAALAGVEEEYRQHIRQLDQMAGNIEQIQQQSETWEREGSARLTEIEEQLSDQKYAREARKALVKIDAELKEIGYQVDAHDEARRKELELRTVEQDYLKLQNGRAALAPLERETAEISAQIEAQVKTLAEQEKLHTEAAAALAVAQVDAPDVAEAERDMLQLQEEENVKRMEVGAAQQEVDVLDVLRQRSREVSAEREGLAQTVSRYKALERAFGKDGVPAMLIEQALPQIEGKANEILERLSGGDMNVSFHTQREYKDRNRDDLRETLDIQISDSAGSRDYELYSGGEAFRINFAIRLALSEVLAQRAGARLQTLVIDEGFGSQDEAGRQRLVEAINMVKQDFEKILVVTHIEALKDAFPTRIEVEKTGQGSSVRVV
jgi:exonuclease SbcC